MKIVVTTCVNALLAAACSTSVAATITHTTAAAKTEFVAKKESTEAASLPSELGQIEEITVTAALFKNLEAVDHPANLLSGEKLQTAAAATLGDTLKSELGVSSASFGPGVGLPVIRGQSDNRVKIMLDSVGSMDASAASPDHAITLEPLLASKIEVLRGPAALRYGSGAIGGVVNVLDNRIPNRLPEAPLSGGTELRYGSGNDETVAVANVNTAVAQVALHVDGIKRSSGDMQIPGFAHVNPSADEHPTAGYVANTDAAATMGSLGASYIGEQGFIGASINKLDNNYGVPPAEQALVRIDMHQTRYDLKGEVNNPAAGWDKLSLHIGHNNYQHTELEDGEAGTQFSNKALEGRLEAFHQPWAGWQGASGLQIARSRFAAVGAEAFIPPSDIHNLGIFIAEENTQGSWRYELGARADQESITPINGGDKLAYKSVNMSGSSRWSFTEQQQLSWGLARSQRAPSIEEALAFGPHPATGSFLIGDAQLGCETSTNIEWGYHLQLARLQSSLNIFHNRVENFIYASNSQQKIENLNAYQYRQGDATFKGFEAEIIYTFSDDWTLRVFGDAVRARLKTGADLPRIPASRVGGSLDFNHAAWSGGINLIASARQDRAGDFEATTASSQRLDANAAYKFNAGQNDYTAFFKITNMLNTEIRNPSSYLRAITPEAGRSVTLGLRVTF